MIVKPYRIGIIDIGSNSIRLVIYDTTPEGGYKVIKESKQAARLSEKITAEGRLEEEALWSIIPILKQFKRVCTTFEVKQIRAGATAAIRNAPNATEIIEFLSRESSIDIKIITGKEEAYFGFLGVINSFDIQDGFVIDIGGGSTEITLFQNRRYQDSISLPFGAVNTNVEFGNDGNWSEEQIHELRSYVLEKLRQNDWMTSSPDLPVFGLGGTIRSLGKIDQKNRHYTMPNSHNYVMDTEQVNDMYELLPSMPFEKRKLVDGLSKNRADIIVSGLIIFHTVYHYIQANRCLISGEGLREGMLHDLIDPVGAVKSSALEYSINTLLTFEAEVSRKHLDHVYGLVQVLYRALQDDRQLEEHQKLLYVSSMLYQIGGHINYYQYNRHTHYWLMNASIRGLTHREIILCALIASYNTKSRKQKLSHEYKDILLASDEEWIHKLGSLVQLGIALDQSETQVVQSIQANVVNKTFHLTVISDAETWIEQEEMESAMKVFKSAWNLKLKIDFPST
ncbi:exopolyphosphatase/guanosine-5'-triphosphate,3'-diphosphate pyrophosphatase [Paenibacillus sp. DS2015]|uniref:Ppx/GppA phosphatase family protein n=1 Tax=Paenibacillus sp. DS2015 TaxID=3373917 RepID=UPI003D1F3B3E